MLVFGPAEPPKHTVTVFTDVDCSLVPAACTARSPNYNKLGIRVRYMFFPRTGPDTESWAKAEAVWCSADRKSGAHARQARQGRDVEGLRQDAGGAASTNWDARSASTGTPGLVLENGELIPGYLPPNQLLAHLAEGSKPASAKLAPPPIAER